MARIAASARIARDIKRLRAQGLFIGRLLQERNARLSETAAPIDYLPAESWQKLSPLNNFNPKIIETIRQKGNISEHEWNDYTRRWNDLLKRLFACEGKPTSKTWELFDDFQSFLGVNGYRDFIFGRELYKKWCPVKTFPFVIRKLRGVLYRKHKHTAHVTTIEKSKMPKDAEIINDDKRKHSDGTTWSSERG
ncbi:MAG: hypothetical protein PHC61_04550, partial [Chitinivibrionales bacterium]|nr:hypothetical protein [Chitinivibrionales bacterium]